MKMSLPVWVVWLGAALPLAAQHTESAHVSPSSQIVEGKRIFEMNCSVGYCHGLEGRAGKGPRLRDRVWVKSYLYGTVEKGIPNSSMPAWQGRLTSQGIDAVVAYILSISHEQSGPETAANKGFETGPDPDVVKSADAGKQLFFDLLNDRNCGTCHRVAGHGTPVARDFPDLAGRPEKLLLTQIEEQPPRCESVKVQLKNGDTVCGIKVNDVDGNMHIYDLTGDGPPVLRTIDRASIATETPCADLNVHGGNGRSYTTGDMLKIVAFLKSIR